MNQLEKKSVVLALEPCYNSTFKSKRIVNARKLCLDSKFDNVLAESNLQNIVKTVKETVIPTVSEEMQEQIFNMTVAQAENNLWFELRKGRITSSTVHSVMATSIRTPSRTVLKNICHGPKKDLSRKVPALAHGKKEEPKAIKAYQVTRMEQNHLNFRVESSGLIMSCENSYLAASPDGLVSCCCCGEGILEVKVFMHPCCLYLSECLS